MLSECHEAKEDQATVVRPCLLFVFALVVFVVDATDAVVSLASFQDLSDFALALRTLLAIAVSIPTGRLCDADAGVFNTAGACYIRAAFVKRVPGTIIFAFLEAISVVALTLICDIAWSGGPCFVDAALTIISLARIIEKISRTSIVETNTGTVSLEAMAKRDTYAGVFDAACAVRITASPIETIPTAISNSLRVTVSGKRSANWIW